MLRSTAWLSAALCGALGCAALTALAAEHGHERIPAYVTAAVDDPGRPEADRKRDHDRKPAEVLAFSGVKPGDKVAELIPAAGYYTRLLSKIVGPQGHDYMLVPAPPANARPRPMGNMKMGGAKSGHMQMSRPSMARRPSMMDEAHALASNPAYPNLSVVPLKMAGGFGLPEPVDVFWTTLNYHDLHNIPHASMAAFNKEVYDALKPGGIYFVVDHAAAKGAGTSVTRKLHRIEPAAARREIEAAGFEFAGASEVLRNPRDSHEKIIFDPSIRGRTDRFIYKFRKP